MDRYCQVCEHHLAAFTVAFEDGTVWDECSGCVMDLYGVAEMFSLTLVVMPLSVVLF